MSRRVLSLSGGVAIAIAWRASLLLFFLWDHNSLIASNDDNEARMVFFALNSIKHKNAILFFFDKIRM